MATAAAAASSSMKRELVNMLTVPSKVASALDWRKLGGSIMTLAVHSDRIEVVAAHHPSYGESSSAVVESLPLAKNGRVVPEFTKQRLADIAREQNVCGIVVSCPIQHDTGKLGYAAGRTLWTLERLFQEDGAARSALPRNRPICLWDGVHIQQPPIDEWGRCSAYAKTSSKSCHLASQEQYHQDEGIVAAQVWEDFMKTNWPDVYRHHPAPLYTYFSKTINSPRDTHVNDHWDNLYQNEHGGLEGMAA
jgi:hypothetical protein